MEFHLLPIFALFCLVLKGSNASLPAEVYWKSKLPNTPMPKALQDLIQPIDAGNKINLTHPQFASRISHGGPSRANYRVGYWAEIKEFNKNNLFNKTTIFFLYDDLLPNKKMRLIFTKSSDESNFMSRKTAESIPFRSNKLPEILNYFSIKLTSEEAQVMKYTIEECEAPSFKGEDKYCATSLESLVDFVITKFGNKVEAFSNKAEEENKEQEYTISKEIKMIGDNQIVCHKERYAYAVFYCHTISSTKAYMVSLMGVNGSTAKAIVICHSDTSAWNPQHFAFQVLKVKPGGPPICHFLNSDTIVWVPN